MKYLIKKIFNDGSIEEMDEDNYRNVDEEIHRFISICDHYTVEECNGGPKTFELYSENGNLIKAIDFNEEFFSESFIRTENILKGLLEESAQHKKR